MFHNIRLPHSVAKMMPLAAVQASSLSPQTIARLSRDFNRSISPSELLRPLQATLPMGFKWAVYIAHTVSTRCMERSYALLRSSAASKCLPSTARMLSLRREPGLRHFRTGDVMLLHIIDDINPVCVDWPDNLVKVFNRICDKVFSSFGLPRKASKSSPPEIVVSSTMPFMGWYLHLRSQTLRPIPGKLQLAVSHAWRCISGSRTSPRELQSVLGRITWIALGIRPSLASLLHCFRFLDSHPHGNRATPAVAKRELFTILRILPLAHVKLHRGTWHTVVAFDASTNAAGVCFAHPSPTSLDSLTKFASEDQAFRSRLTELKLHAHVRSMRWRLAFSHTWKRAEHINALEAHAAVLAVEWAAAHPINGQRLVILSDSAVVIGALKKGRSSSPALALPCRRFAAVIIAHDLHPIFIHVPSESNPADGPSRGREIWQ